MSVAAGEGRCGLSSAMLTTVDLNAMQLAVRRIDRAIIAWLESDLFPNIVFGCIAIAVVLNNPLDAVPYWTAPGTRVSVHSPGGEQHHHLPRGRRWEQIRTLQHKVQP
jgi:hypothetical protein